MDNSKHFCVMCGKAVPYEDFEFTRRLRVCNECLPTLQRQWEAQWNEPVPGSYEAECREVQRAWVKLKKAIVAVIKRDAHRLVRWLGG